MCAVDKVEKALKRRASIDDLKEKGIYKTPQQAVGDRLEREIASDQVEQDIRKKQADQADPSS